MSSYYSAAVLYPLTPVYVVTGKEDEKYGDFNRFVQQSVSINKFKHMNIIQLSDFVIYIYTCYVQAEKNAVHLFWHFYL